MKLLIGYLLSLTILLGGAAVGLAWLASPERNTPVKAGSSSRVASQAKPVAKVGQMTVLPTQPRADSADAVSVTAAEKYEPKTTDTELPVATEISPTQNSPSVPARQSVAAPANPPVNTSNAPQRPAGVIAKRSTDQKKQSHRYVLMRLQTIEFPDGRRVSRLLPMTEKQRSPIFEAF
jgi:hypothetical protein